MAGRQCKSGRSLCYHHQTMQRGDHGDVPDYGDLGGGDVPADIPGDGFDVRDDEKFGEGHHVSIRKHCRLT